MDIEREYLGFVQEHLQALDGLIRHQATIVTSLDEASKGIDESRELISRLKEELTAILGNLNKVNSENNSLQAKLDVNIKEHQQSLSQLDLECKMRANTIYSLMQQRDRLKQQLDAVVHKNALLLEEEREKNEEELIRLQKLNESTKMKQSGLHQKFEQLEAKASRLKERKRSLLASLPMLYQ